MLALIGVFLIVVSAVVKAIHTTVSWLDFELLVMVAENFYIIFPLGIFFVLEDLTGNTILAGVVALLLAILIRLATGGIL